MANVVFNIAKGRVAHYGLLTGGANDGMLLVLLKTAGLQADATLIDHDTLSVLLAAANDEADFTGYTRRALANVTVTVDDTNERVDVDADSPSSYTNSGASQAVSKALVCYDPDTTAGDDTTIVPLVALDCVVTFDTGVPVTLSFDAAGWFRAA